MKKKIALMIAIIVIFAVGATTVYHFRYYFFRTSSAPVKAKENRDFGIESFKSSVDKDGDGIDDQTDILEGARAYIQTSPIYKSKYYKTGYPDDHYGVCTDVVANALVNAGYDLRELVDQDIVANPGDYGIEKPDSCIDFRRVKNLKVYFKHTAVPLTTDVSKIEEWQGGDIIIFKQHIGIVSDKRNKNGVPYVIHHNDPYQKSYEEDILEKRHDIVAHYRVSE